MFRWRRRLLFAPLILGLAVAAAPAATAAPAADTVITVTGGSATTVTAPGVVGKLALAGIVPLVRKPGSMRIGGSLTNLTATTTFPLTGGSIDFTTFNGQVQAGGGLRFISLFGLRTVKLTDLQVEIVNGVTTLTTATPSGARISLFALSLSGAKLGGDATHVVISNLATTITAQGAQFLDSALRTKVFTAGMLFGTSTSTFQHS
jgi:Htaa